MERGEANFCECRLCAFREQGGNRGGGRPLCARSTHFRPSQNLTFCQHKFQGVTPPGTSLGFRA